jgi:hypothetical protein
MLELTTGLPLLLVCEANRIWHCLPGDLDRWWRAGAKMHLLRVGEDWQIIGPAHRARVAYATRDGERLLYSFA